MPDLAKVVILAVIVFAILFSGITTFSIFTDDAELSSTPRTGEPVLLDGTSQYSTIDNSLGRDETVYNSLGYAVNLSGSSDSYVQSSSNIDFATDDTWTVSLWAKLSPVAQVQTRTVASYNGRLVITYYPMQGNWSAWYYDDGSTDSYVVNVSAVGEKTALQNVMVRRNGTHLAIYQNNTVGDVKNVTLTNIADAPASPANWHGDLDEMRTFDDALNNSQRQQLVDSPVAPLKATNRTSRIMFDESGASQQLLFFSSGHIDQSNVTFSDGLDGSVMDGKDFINDITGSTDYVWEEDGPQIYVVEGGELDGAPVAYVDYDFFPFGGAQQSWTDNITQAMNMAALVPSVMLFVVVIGYLLLLRGR